jgi:hypothetical protein
MIFCARATRALRRASFDGRTSTNMSALPREGERASLEGAIDRNVSLDACNTERPHLPPLLRFSIGPCSHKSTCDRKVLEL